MCAADPYADDLKRFAAAVPVVTYAINDRSADVHAEKVVLGIWESEITVRTPIGHLRIITPLIGRNNVYNVLAAVATGLSINVPLKVRHSSLLQLSPSMVVWHAWHLPVHTKGLAKYQINAVRPACTFVAGILWLTLLLGLSDWNSSAWSVAAGKWLRILHWQALHTPRHTLVIMCWNCVSRPILVAVCADHCSWH